MQSWDGVVVRKEISGRTFYPINLQMVSLIPSLMAESGLLHKGRLRGSRADFIVGQLGNMEIFWCEE